MANFFAILSMFAIFYMNNKVADGLPSFGNAMDPIKFGLKMEKLTHLQVYWHDKPSGPVPTTILVASANFTNPTIGFGSIIVIDDALTVGPELDSELVGRAQGSYVLASLAGQPAAAVMSMTFAFTAGEYNGSSISIAGRNTVLSAVREMPITGGTGVFRFARGYVQLRTHFFDTNGDASVKYDIYALHY
ncbi:hypothetical protein MKW94_030050 [Papaver nudicaule]|uniref:Dirigent protein n=1 Tax=Papaver nudicaule TaxID=74823 RepID=A0AA42AYT6_PAPNU|nr:hypothetical protein [Papaver nudicaule]